MKKTICLTREQFNNIAMSAITAVSLVEQWDAEHPSWKIVEDGQPQPSRVFRAELRRQLQAHGIPVT